MLFPSFQKSGPFLQSYKKWTIFTIRVQKWTVFTFDLKKQQQILAVDGGRQNQNSIQL
jgi:hypothetical protein